MTDGFELGDITDESGSPLSDHPLTSIAAASSEVLIGPRLVAIYSDEEGKAEPDQIGTGFLLNYEGQSTLITAAHCLYGSTEDHRENPGDKLVFTGGTLKRLAEVTVSELNYSLDRDIAAVIVSGFSDLIPQTAITHAHEMAHVVVVHGYLARDFRRSKTNGALRPAPFIYQDKRLSCRDGNLRFKFPRKTFNTLTNERSVAPIPRGLSGCPMLDGIALLRGEIGICGVFTEWADGVGSGPSRQVLIELLQSLVDHSQT